jgi:methylenetetrahydrofolate reductase (NADPH)
MSRLQELLSAGRPVITAELPSVDRGGWVAVRRCLTPLAAHADAVNVTDNTAAHAHASALAVAIAVRACGAEPIMQLVCRDRNRLALQSDIMGAALHGIENLCCLTGDDVSAGDEPEALGVFDLDGAMLLDTARTLADGSYLAGRPIDPPPRLFVGAVESPGPRVEPRVARALDKAARGARFLQLQVSFRPELLERFLARAVDAGLTDRSAVLPSILIVGSATALRHVDERVSGVEVPAATIERVESAVDAAEECLEVAAELAAHALALPGVAGLHLISFRPDGAVAELCARVGVPTRRERDRAHAATAS